MNQKAWTLVISSPLEKTGLRHDEIIKGAEFTVNHHRPDEPYAEVTADNGQKFWVVVHEESKRVLACTPNEMKEYRREGGIGFRVESEEGLGKTRPINARTNKKVGPPVVG